jgi:hypothetical protein
VPSKVDIYEDESDPDIQIRWLDREGGEPFDFSTGWAATVQFIRERRNQIVHTKSTGFLLGDGAGGLANVVIALAPNELSTLAGVPGLVMKLILVQDGTGERKVFRVLGAYLPPVRVRAAAAV